MLVRRDDYYLQEQYYLSMLADALFIHPTDTHYSIGCDATNSKLCMRLRLLKRWQVQPLHIIAPSKEWIRENMEVSEEALRQLPGPITLVARMKNPDCVCADVHLGLNSLGVRIPDHWISDIVRKLGVPVVSSCANRCAENLMTSVDNADPQLVSASAVVLDEGPKQGKPMVFVYYTETTHVITQ